MSHGKDASSPDSSSSSNYQRKGPTKDEIAGRKHKSSSMFNDAVRSGQNQKHSDPPELITERHQTAEESGGSVAALDQGMIPGTGVNPTHPSREGSPQGQPRKPVVAPSLRVSKALVEESERSYSAGRGEIQTIAVCNEPREPVVAPSLRVTEAQEQQQANQSFPTDSKERETQTDAETGRKELKRW